MISPTDQQVHCWAWLKKYMPEDSNLILEDVTWKYTGKGPVGVRGPSGVGWPSDPGLSSPFAFFTSDVQECQS